MPRNGDRHRFKARVFRPPDDLWEAFKRKVADEGKSVNEVLIRLIRRYVDDDSPR